MSNSNTSRSTSARCISFKGQNASKDLKKVSKEVNIRNQYNQAPHLTQDTTQESDKNTVKHHTQQSQEVSPFPAGEIWP